MSEKNPTREIFYYVNHGSKLVYIHMSLMTGESEMRELFPAAEKINRCAGLQMWWYTNVKKYEVVFVGDDKVIDEFFTEEKIKS